MSLCRAKGCFGDRMPNSDFCGFHDEMCEDGEAFDIKPHGKKPELTMEQKAAKWEALRERDRLRKRRKHPEWKHVTRREGAKSTEEMAALYDKRLQRDREYKERDLSYATKEIRRAIVGKAVMEVLDEVKRKRDERKAKGTS